MNKILLCAINSKYIHSSLAVHSIKAAFDFYVQKCSQDNSSIFPTVIVNEFTINDSYQSVLFKIIEENPDIFSFSVYLWNIEYISKLCKDLKKLFPEKKIILGGPEVSYGIEEEFFSESDYDYVISGEGENSYFALICKICDIQVPLNEISDGTFDLIINKKNIRSKVPPVLDKLPFVYNDNNIHLFKNRIVYYESSRGCPFNCAYCLSSAEHGVRFLSLERIYKDIDFFTGHNVPLVKFVDRTFNANKKRSYQILKYIIENGKNTCFHFEVAADLFDNDTLDLLKSAPKGRIQFEIGIQSTNNKALKESCRTIDTNKVLHNISELISMENINIHADLIAGLPYETYSEFSETFNETYKYCIDEKHYIHQLQIGFLKLLRGAPLNDMIDKHGYVFSNNPPYTVLKNNYLSPYELNLLISFEDVFERYYNSNRFHTTLSYISKNNFLGSDFEFYTLLAKYYKDNKLLFLGISSRRMYDILHSFLSTMINIKEVEKIDELLLYDYFASDSSDLPPDSLRYIWKSERYYKNEALEILHNNNMQPDKKNTVRFIKDKIYIFDYSSKNPVTDRFKEVNLTCNQ